MSVNTTARRRHLKGAFLIIGFVFSVLTVISLVVFGRVLFFVPVWIWLSNYLANSAAVDIWLARAIASVILLPFLWFISLLFSFKREKRKQGIILFLVASLMFCLAMFLISKNIYFSPETGEARKWYIEMPNGEYKFSDSPGFDPVWGIEYKKVNQEVVKSHKTQDQEGSYASGNQNEYFDVKTGNAKKWYLILSNERIIVRSYPGFDKEYGKRLKPVTPDIIWKIQKKELLSSDFGTSISSSGRGHPGALYTLEVKKYQKVIKISDENLKVKKDARVIWEKSNFFLPKQGYIQTGQKIISLPPGKRTSSEVVDYSDGNYIVWEEENQKGVSGKIRGYFQKINNGDLYFYMERQTKDVPDSVYTESGTRNGISKINYPSLMPEPGNRIYYKNSQGININVYYGQAVQSISDTDGSLLVPESAAQAKDFYCVSSDGTSYKLTIRKRAGGALFVDIDPIEADES